ncbi:MAG: hypothetical protein ACOC1F_04140 [Myxococcota bacterium]
MTDIANCGFCGNACDPGEVCDGAGNCTLSCQQGLVDCNGTCIDPLTDETYCGASGDCSGANTGETCGASEICDGSGNCSASCAPPLVVCSDACTNTSYDPAQLRHVRQRMRGRGERDGRVRVGSLQPGLQLGLLRV